jgi:HlyD family secretion protein
MSWLQRAWRWGRNAIVVGSIALSAFLTSTHQMGAWPWNDRRPLRERFLFMHVSRTDLNPVLNAPGILESSKSTTIVCELENIAGVSGGGSTMLTVLPEGTPVKRGDVLATLDSSTYEEMLRQQAITVEQAKASHLQAQLNLEIALLAVREYSEGTVRQTLQGMEGSIALARSDLSRAKEHLTWTKRMKEKGYSTPAQVVSEQHSVVQLELALTKQLTSLELFQRFTLPITEKSMQGQITSAETAVANETLRMRRQLERFALLKKQVDRCTIHAPHDGVLLYSQDRRQGIAIEEGMPVRQKQPLFSLPDFSEMQVQVYLNESVVHRVVPGQRVSVTFEAVHNLVLTGRVISVGQIPLRMMVRSSGDRQGMDTGVRFFTSIVKLDKVNDALKPGMTAIVDMELLPRQHVLAIRHEAVRTDRGKKVCYVAHDESLERRELKIGQDTADLVEVLDGLNEGELVALNPPHIIEDIEPSMNFDEFRRVDATDHDSVAASQQ